MTSDECEALAAWVRLTLAPGVGGETQRALLRHFGGPEHVFSAAVATLSQVVSRSAAQSLLGHDCSAQVEGALRWAEEPGNRILTLADAEYPRRLLDTPDPPTLLYVKGKVELIDRPALAVVGSRNGTPQGVRDAEMFAESFAHAGLTVVSGLALGIDSAAHRGGLKGAASTSAVIGTGADRVYPARNHGLAQRIALEGAVVSEFPLGTPAIAANFPRRNRIIAGLTLGVLVVEAATQSGSLITARLAAEQGREVFAIPSSIHSPLSKGCHRLIKDGAKLVESAEDVLSELGLDGPLSLRPAVSTPDDPGGTQLLSLLGFDPCNLDTIVERSGLTPEALSAMLLQMELDGRVAKLPGGRFQRLV